ncbi:unnamed protein product [Sphagnum jensenii]
MGPAAAGGLNIYAADDNSGAAFGNSDLLVLLDHQTGGKLKVGFAALVGTVIAIVAATALQLCLPFLGESLEYLSASRANRSLEFYKVRIAKYGEIFKTHLLLCLSISLGAPEGNKFLFANENKLVQNSWPPSVVKLLGRHSLATKTGEEHKKARRIFASFFGPDGLQSFVPRMDQTVRSHLDQCWENKEEVMGVETLKQFTFSLVANLFLSIKDGPEFNSMAHDIELYLGGIMQLPLDFPGTSYHKARLARESLLQTLGTIISRRRKAIKEGQDCGHHDLFSVLMNRPHNQGDLITDEEIKDNIVLFLFAGHDTSSITPAAILKYLSLNPHCLHEVVKEQKEIAKVKAGAPLNWDDTRKMKYTSEVIQETLRLQPPVQAAFREALQEFEYEGLRIPKGCKVFWSVWRSHMLPEIFPNPTKFDPSSFEKAPPPFTFVPFGGGPHSCIGKDFARTEIMVFLHYLVLNYEWSVVHPNEKISYDPMPIFEKGLPLKVHKKV